ncbi:hypothetical protein H6P81_018532 [Aristolochia fimbriata]|uniref:Uncharacterized protein n=1 Tax=Aristolochia fimbriata TaxID=158543 RepID=A0AAV7E281_ARIFI|nr:hypothetical protein H6P81_018532 [Aristolochia fimbriata]
MDLRFNSQLLDLGSCCVCDPEMKGRFENTLTLMAARQLRTQSWHNILPRRSRCYGLGVVVNSYIKGFLEGFKSSGKEVFYARLVKIQKRKMKMLICASVESPETTNMLSDSSSCLKQQS